jgi:uncharacterized DUF497 family protein
MPFEWGLVKASTNVDKHGVSSEEAASIFRGFCVHQRDTRQDCGGPRFVALGLDSNGVLLNVVYTPRGDNIRIISAWKASRHEREAYAKAQQSKRSV